jgi:hypothetical protein
MIHLDGWQVRHTKGPIGPKIDTFERLAGKA